MDARLASAASCVAQIRCLRRHSWRAMGESIACYSCAPIMLRLRSGDRDRHVVALATVLLSCQCMRSWLHLREASRLKPRTRGWCCRPAHAHCAALTDVRPLRRRRHLRFRRGCISWHSRGAVGYSGSGWRAVGGCRPAAAPEPHSSFCRRRVSPCGCWKLRRRRQGSKLLR